MNIKISNIESAKSDASVILECASSFESLVDTMIAIRSSIDSDWSDCESKFSAINNLSRCAYYYNYRIIPALKKLGTAINNYAAATQQLSENGAITSNASLSKLSSSSVESTSYSDGNNSLDISVYKSIPELGFNVTTNNATYELNDSDFDLFCSIVSAECDKSYDDSLAVATTILNRCEDATWVNYVGNGGDNPLKQATFPGQFVVYEQGLYKQYLNGNSPSEVQRAVSDALAGVRNHEYLGFRSNESYSYSNNMITSSGNRYK